MKRLILMVVLAAFFGVLASSAQAQPSVTRVSARRHHHATRHHAHKAGRRHRARHAHSA
jgi:Ni/Co efflux regulator RcnB